MKTYLLISGRDIKDISLELFHTCKHESESGKGMERIEQALRQAWAQGWYDSAHDEEATKN